MKGLVRPMLKTVQSSPIDAIKIRPIMKNLELHIELVPEIRQIIKPAARVIRHVKMLSVKPTTDSFQVYSANCSH